MDRPINDRPLSAENAEQIDEFAAMSELSPTTVQKYRGQAIDGRCTRPR
jgi:hypothetical protein